MNETASAVITPSTIMTGMCARNKICAVRRKPSSLKLNDNAVSSPAPATERAPQQNAPTIR